MKLLDIDVLDQRHYLLETCAGEGPTFIALIEHDLKRIGAPGVAFKQVTVEPSILKGFLGRRRDFLRITCAGLREYQILITCQDLGIVLHVAWLLVGTPKLGSRLHRMATMSPEDRDAVGAELDAFSRLDLCGWVSLTKYVIKRAVTDVAEDKKIDVYSAGDPLAAQTYTNP